MGSKMIIITSFFLFFFYTKNRAQSMKEKQKILLNYALCDCLSKNYFKVDSTIVLNDLSLSVYMQEYSFLSFETAVFVDSLINSNPYPNNVILSHTFSQNSNSNQVFKFCSDLIESNKLIIKKLLKE